MINESDIHTGAALTPCLEEAKGFLYALDPLGQFTFQAIPEAEGTTTRATVRHGALDEHAVELEALNRNGAGIFVMVNEGDGVIRPGARTCRTEANVRRVRALFVDLDGAPIAPVLEGAMPPDWVVQSSPGRWHAYWAVVDCPLREFSSSQLALAKKYSGDPAVKDLPRVMRLPGFVHRKAQPFCSQLVPPADYQKITRTRS